MIVDKGRQINGLFEASPMRLPLLAVTTTQHYACEYVLIDGSVARSVRQG